MNIGFFLPHVTNNETHVSIINTINNLATMSSNNIVVFNNYFHYIDDHKKYYILSSNHAKYFQGLLFVFKTEDTFLTQTFPAPTKQILYLNTPEWSNNRNIPYTVWHNIYMNTRYEIIAGNQDVYDIFEICWKKPIAIAESFNTKDVENVIQSFE